MKIVLCHNQYQHPGGEDQVFGDETWLLESRGHTVLRYTKHNDTLAQMSRLAAACNTLWNRQTYREFRSLLRRYQPDVVHCTNTFPLISPAIYYAARAEGVPVVQSLHNYRLLCPNAQFLRDGRACEDCLGKLFAWPGVLHGCYRGSRSASAVVAGMVAAHRLLGTWTRLVDRYIALAKVAREKLIAGGLPAERISVKPNFVPSTPAAGHGRGGYVLFVGRLSPEKGIEVLLDAWPRLSQPVRLLIVGDGPLADRVRQAAADDARIEWLGRRPGEEVISLMAEASALLLPSICYEVCPKTLIESLAVGTPIVASRLGSMIEMVADGRTGWHFEPGNAADLAACVDRVWHSRHKLSSFRQAARDEFEQKYTADANYTMLMDIYARAGAAPHKAATVGRAALLCESITETAPLHQGSTP